MYSKIQRFQIIGLHGYKNFDLRLEDNVMILVGENGSGKTTVLRLLCYLLAGKGGLMLQYKFKELRITINDELYQLPYDLLGREIAKVDQRFLSRFPHSVREELRKVMREEGSLSLPDLEIVCKTAGIPFRILSRELGIGGWPPDSHSKELSKLFNSINQAVGSQILYLPTYRRIEQELNMILHGTDEEREEVLQRRLKSATEKQRIFVELVEFGMRDVQKAVDDTSQRLKDFDHGNLNSLTLGYLGDVVDKKYAEVELDKIQTTTDETIKSVLDRIPESILSRTQKAHLSEKIADVKNRRMLDEHAKVICHYFLKLLYIQDELRKKEFNMTMFCDVCNEYMKNNKRFTYESAEFKLFIKNTDPAAKGRTIEFRHLSSGEKQIASLFSHLYLSGGETYFVLIDEPELSLSVPWQRRFLVDIQKGGFCSGLVAVTHSPFIYENELKKYARGLGEFEF